MTNVGIAVVALGLVSVNLYSCHRPTDSEQYADGIRCYGAFTANLKQLSEAQMPSAGIDRYAVESAADQTATAVFNLGRSMRKKPSVVYADLKQSEAEFLKSHSWEAEAGRRHFSALDYDFRDCLADFYGRPND